MLRAVVTDSDGPRWLLEPSNVGFGHRGIKPSNVFVCRWSGQPDAAKVRFTTPPPAEVPLG